MVEAAASLGDDDIAAIAHYLSAPARPRRNLWGASNMLKGLWVALALVPLAARAAPLEDTRAFDRAFAASFYAFDACGDGKYGALFRRALNARFAQCPFSPQAQAAHRRRNALQAEKSRERMEALIEETGGVPLRLARHGGDLAASSAPSLTTAAIRTKLESYSEGAAKLEDVLPAPCDAEAITP